MTRHYEIIQREVCYQGFFRLERYRLRHDLFSGGSSRVLTRELLERGHAAAVLPYDPERDAVVLIEQFRIGALDDAHGPWLLEIVAGMMEEGESAEDLARREAVEEAGCIIQELLPVCDYLVSPGGASERIHLFCGRVDSRHAGGVHGIHEEGEDILAHVVSFAEAMRWLEQGRIRSASPIIALQWLALHRDELRQRWLGASA
ncbi:MAG: ADP-ribose diphosphatase [Gammaproteobacteria bacterium]|nr:ADP-ribose diphosphatase [Gammaproteobacteria bacterium]MCL5669558.1 ADP-ribose diphosphatase [Gammaproteobacteria bacterium]